MSKPQPETDDMQPEYDFSTATRGKFHRAGAVLVPPVHLEPDVRAWLMARAQARGITLSEFVNDLIRKDIALIETAG